MRRQRIHLIIFTIIMITSSPSATASCNGFRCPPNMQCRVVPIAGPVCTCKLGFVAANSGTGCVRKPSQEPDSLSSSSSQGLDSCNKIICPLSRTTGICINGQCVCKTGFRTNFFGTCVWAPSCDRIVCPRNMICRSLPTYGTFCQCRDGHVKSLNGLEGCEKIGENNVCSPRSCPESNSVCIQGRCRCKAGHRRDRFGTCVRELPCKDKWTLCPLNSRCKSVGCECNAGFRLRGTVCQPLFDEKACDCGQNQKCERGKCVCLTGYVMVPEGIACEIEMGTWSEWSEWKSCSATCNGGAQLRHRECQGVKCVGSPIESQICNEASC